jgi:protein TonB
LCNTKAKAAFLRCGKTKHLASNPVKSIIMKENNRSPRHLERIRGVFIRTGFVCSLFITFIAFQYRTPVVREEITVADPWEEIAEEDMPVTRHVVSMNRPSVTEVRNRLTTQVTDHRFTEVPDADSVSAPPADSVTPVEIFIPRPAESDSAEDIPVMRIPEVMPRFPGGDSALAEFLTSAIKYPDMLRREGIDGTAYIGFVVDEKGKVTDINCLRTTHAAFGDEAIRVVSAMPAWSPGMQGGRRVKVIMTLPVIFRLQ